MPGLKYITVPQDIELKDMLSDTPILSDDGKPFSVTFKQFAFRILGHESFAASFEVLRSAHAIADSFQKAKAGETAILAEEDWNRLVEGVKTHFSSVGLASLGIMQLMPYFDAVLKASDSPQK